MMFEQGDVLVKSFEDDIPKNSKKVFEGKDKILAEGETTGHSHRIKSDENCYMYEAEVKGVKCLLLEVLDKPATLFHEEHGQIKIPKGKYLIDRVQEYDHFKMEARSVQD